MSSRWLLACSLRVLAIFSRALLSTLDTYAGVHASALCASAIELVFFPSWNSRHTVDSWLESAPIAVPHINFYHNIVKFYLKMFLNGLGRFLSLSSLLFGSTTTYTESHLAEKLKQKNCQKQWRMLERSSLEGKRGFWLKAVAWFRLLAFCDSEKQQLQQQ